MSDSHSLKAGHRSPGSQRVFITGIGMVTALGHSWSETWQAIRAGTSAVAPTTRFASHTDAVPLAAEIRAFDPRPHFRIPKAIKLTDLKTQLAVAAAGMAVESAGLDIDAGIDDLEILVGCSSSDIQVDELARGIAGPHPESCAGSALDFGRRVMGGLNPLWLLINLPNMTSAHVGIQLASTGPNRTLMTDWIAGTQALGEAFLAIRHHETDLAVAGGADTGVLPFYVGCYESSNETPRESLAFGEGAAMMVLESEQSVTRRGGRILGEVCAYSSSSLSGPEGSADTALSTVLEEALDASGWDEAEIDFVCCSRSDFDQRQPEQNAVERLRRATSAPPTVGEFQSQLGHCLAASGAIDAALALSHLREQGPGRRGLCWSLGLLGQAAALALMTTEETDA